MEKYDWKIFWTWVASIALCAAFWGYILARLFG